MEWEGDDEDTERKSKEKRTDRRKKNSVLIKDERYIRIKGFMIIACIKIKNKTMANRRKLQLIKGVGNAEVISSEVICSQLMNGTKMKINPDHSSVV